MALESIYVLVDFRSWKVRMTDGICKDSVDVGAREVEMQKVVLGLGVLFSLLLGVPAAQALTCTQQAQACARKAKEVGKPEYAPKCLSSARVAACRKTCVFSGTNGSTWPASGDCKSG